MNKEVTMQEIGKADKKEDKKFSVHYNGKKIGEVFFDKAKGRFTGQVEHNGKASKPSHRNTTAGLLRQFTSWLKRATQPAKAKAPAKPKSAPKLPPKKKPASKPTTATQKAETAAPVTDAALEAQA